MRRLALVLLALTAGALPAVEVAVAYPGVAEPAVNERRLRDILLGRVTTWSDGTPITLVLVDDAPTSAAIAAASGRDLAQLLRGWKRLVYAGSGAMPMVVTTQRAALDEVSRRSGALTVLAQ